MYMAQKLRNHWMTSKQKDENPDQYMKLETYLNRAYYAYKQFNLYIGEPSLSFGKFLTQKTC